MRLNCSSDFWGYNSVMKACQKGCLPQDDIFFIQRRLIHLILNLKLIRLIEVLLWNTCVVPTPAEINGSLVTHGELKLWWSLKRCETQDTGNLPWRSSTTCVLKRFIRQSATQLSVLGISPLRLDNSLNETYKVRTYCSSIAAAAFAQHLGWTKKLDEKNKRRKWWRFGKTQFGQEQWFGTKEVANGTGHVATSYLQIFACLWQCLSGESQVTRPRRFVANRFLVGKERGWVKPPKLDTARFRFVNVWPWLEIWAYGCLWIQSLLSQRHLANDPAWMESTIPKFLSWVTLSDVQAMSFLGVVQIYKSDNLCILCQTEFIGVWMGNHRHLYSNMLVFSRSLSPYRSPHQVGLVRWRSCGCCK